MTMLVASLASGSSGNSYYVESDDGAVIVDAGLSAKKLVANIHAAGGDPYRVEGVVVTHDHTDHISGAGILQRKFGWRLWMTEGTLAAAEAKLGKVRVETIRPGAALKAAGMEIALHPTPHDGVEPVMVSLTRGAGRCGIFTDLGHAFEGLADRMNEVDFLFLESNYDPGMLAGNRRYPPPLKARIKGRGGHLSNREAAELALGLKGTRLKKIVLSHLSKENNSPGLARECFTGVMAERMKEEGIKVGVAPRYEPMRLCRVL